MRKSIINGSIELISDKAEKYINFEMALLSAQSLAYVYASQGYLTTMSANKTVGRVEVTVHFTNKSYMKPIPGIQPTYYRITSHCYYRNHRVGMQRIRCKDFYFLADASND